MNRVTLLFNDERDLKRFNTILDSPYIEMNPRELTISCECSQEDIDLAIKAFGAKVIEIEKAQQ